MHYNNRCNCANGYANKEPRCHSNCFPCYFRFLKKNAITNMGIPCVSFQLRYSGQLVNTSTSGQEGEVEFIINSPGEYEIIEVATPEGYMPNTVVNLIYLDSNACIWVDGVEGGELTVKNTPIITGTFTILTSDFETNEPLSDAVFVLRQNDIIVQTGITDSTGLVTFSGLSPGTYQLSEIASPPGYLPNTQIYTVVVAADGSITIDNLPVMGLQILNTPRILTEFQFLKVDISTGDGLAQAVYTLTSLEGDLIATATSGVLGEVSFSNIVPGTYILEEIAAPPGYILGGSGETPVPTTFLVIVTENGTNIVIDDVIVVPAEDFRASNIPVIP